MSDGGKPLRPAARVTGVDPVAWPPARVTRAGRRARSRPSPVPPTASAIAPPATRANDP